MFNYAEPTKAYEGALTTTLTTTLYTVPANSRFAVNEIQVNNTDTVVRTFTMSFGTTPTTMFSTVTLQAGENRTFGRGTILNAAETIKGGASANSVVNCMISGRLFT